MLTVGAQAGGALAGLEFPPFAQDAKDGAPTFVFTTSRTPTLFDGIVRGLAGDHDVVDVALAEAGAADAHEPCFLQEFGNRAAAAVAHTRFQSAYHLMNDHCD